MTNKTKQEEFGHVTPDSIVMVMVSASGAGEIQRDTSDWAIDAIKQLIIADRKRVALEARINELEKIEIGGDNIWTVDSGTDTAMLIEERIAGLKAQQEEV